MMAPKITHLPQRNGTKDAAFSRTFPTQLDRAHSVSSPSATMPIRRMPEASDNSTRYTVRTKTGRIAAELIRPGVRGTDHLPV